MNVTKAKSVMGSWVRQLKPKTGREIESALYPEHRTSAVEQVGEDPVRWATQVAYDMASRISGEMPGFGAGEAAIRTMQKGTESAAVHTLLSIDVGHIVGEITTPEVAEQMREYVHRRVPLPAIWEAIRSGHAEFADLYMSACRDLVPAEQQPAQLELISRILFQFVNPFTSGVGDAYTEQYEHWIASANAARDEMVRRVLAGDETNPDIAREKLNYTLEHRHHVALVLWQPEPDPHETTALQQTASELLAEIGVRKTLLMAVGQGELWAWGCSPAAIADDAVAGLKVDNQRVAVTAGRVRTGLDGFRSSHHQALRAAAAIRWCPHALGKLHPYDDVSLVALLSSAGEWSSDFVEHELGALWGEKSYQRELRETLLTYFECKRSPQAAAARLFVARNTVLYRLRRAEEMLGHAVDARELELWAALRIAAQDLTPHAH